MAMGLTGCTSETAGGPELAGIWLEGGKVYDADGKFIQNMSAFYDDPTWQMFDPQTGKINVTDTEVSCRAAARPDVDEQYENHCVEGQIDYLDDDVVQTFVIPLIPVAAESITDRVGHDGVSVIFNGARLDGSAPTDAILTAHTPAPFDDCGGHVNPAVGYHIHAVTDCFAPANASAGGFEDHADKIALALDGYSIFEQLGPDGTEPGDLNACRGHSTTDLGYHYHAGAPGSNAILGCHMAQVGCVLTAEGESCDASQTIQRGPPGGDRPERGPPPADR